MSKRMTRPSVLLAAIFVAAFLAAGIVPMSPWPVAVVYADGCHPVNTTCTGNDPTKTSVLTVLHQDVNSSLVQPTSGEDWDIRAEWRTAAGCSNAFETAACRVTWNGTAWVLSNVNLTTHIVAISICNAGSCTSTGGTHGFAYKLYVDINDPAGAPTKNLHEVRYQTTSIDDGRTTTLTGLSTCTTLGSTVSPISQTVTQYDTPSDWGDQRCPYQCSTGGSTPSITITYQ